MVDDDTSNRPSRSRFTIGFLLWLLCVTAIGFSAYNRWIAKDYGERAHDAEMVARDNGIKFIDIWVDYFEGLPRFDDDGNVNLHECRPYVDLTDPNLDHADITRLLRYLRDLLPDEGRFSVAVFLSSDIFADPTYVAYLRDELPRCEIFDRGKHPVFFNDI